MAIVVIIVMMCVLGIVLLNLNSSGNEEEARQKYLGDLARIMETELKPMQAHKDSYSITFEYKNKIFVYEDIVTHIGETKNHRAFLRVQTNKIFSLNFNERIVGSSFNTDIISGLQKASDNVDSSKINLDLPKVLKDFSVLVDDIVFANEFLNDHKVVSILKAYKNIDTRGCPNMAICVRSGELVLEFTPQDGHVPNLQTLAHDPHTLEDHVKRLTVLVRKLTDVEE